MAIAVALTGPLYLWVARASDCRRVSVGARWWRFSPLIALVLVGAPVSASVALAQDVLPIDDAYHYRFFANGRHDGNYVEWWYFNFFDARQGVQAIFTYFIADPEDLSGRGLAQLVAYTSQGIVGGVGVYSPDSFSASYAQADAGAVA
ncbi:MAG: hypothetical protein HY725_05475 [Candidatus Rokubacteria bacterium]|nr:hypothetical protein [Candidatus Rokubacteria bacterium]